MRHLELGWEASLHKGGSLRPPPTNGADRRHVVGFPDLFIDVFLEVQNKRTNSILYLIDYIAYGLYVWYKINIFKEISRKYISLHPGLGSSLLNFFPGYVTSCKQTNGNWFLG